MHGSVLSAAQLGVTVALVAWMITGFTRLPGRWMRWRMFCRATTDGSVIVPGLPESMEVNESSLFCR
ncbi:hypothetical protein ACFRIC_38990 [Streptomyces sp. NPDC056738]|uniref:hypothetical protein n=1 Tax=Streptomyces sp. NPDC056738 TaxID=3345933 RepID=UPI00368E749A